MTFAMMLVPLLTAIMIFFLVINSFQAFLLMCAVPELWSHWQLADDEYFQELIGSDALPPISVVTSYRGEEGGPVALARMLLSLNYPRFEVILVVDGNRGEALRELVEAFDLYEVPAAFTVNLATSLVRSYYRSRAFPRLLCIDKEPGSPGDDLNAAINAARFPHVLPAEARVIFEHDALLRLSRPFLLDRAVACVGGIARRANIAITAEGERIVSPIRGWAAGCENVEFLRNVALQRLGWNRIASNTAFPSATVLFRREDFVALGGFDPAEPAPALELSVRIHKYLTDTGVNARMPVIPDPVAWTVAPQSIRTIGLARRRVLRGLIRVLSRNMSMLLNPEYGAFGMLAMPYLWLGMIAAPVLEVVGYAGLVIGLLAGVLDSTFTLAYLASVVGYGILLSVWTVVFHSISFQRLDGKRHFGRLIAFAVAEAVGYRQIVAAYRASAVFAERKHG
jgi:cellulose synthase/poly-beta-1,6-N-acetylglucosamine synthase-like glycosyltransferase